MSYQHFALSGIDADRTRALVGELAEVYGAHPLMRAFVVQQVLAPARVPPYNDLAAVAAIHRWVRDEVRFVREAGEQVLTPARVLIWRFGDCDDRSGLVAAMLQSIDIKWRLELLARGGVPFHIWPQALVGGRWIEVETSHPRAKLHEHPAALMHRLTVSL